MKLPRLKGFRLKGFRSTIGIRTMGQFLALALAPIGGIAAVLYADSALTPALIEQLQLVALASAIAALVLGAVQSEFTVRRLDRLIESTRRVARHDFSVAAPVEGKDEVSEVMRAFNDMARNLGVSLSVQGVLAQMDDAVLTKLDVGALIRSALRCLRLVTLADVVVLGLFESDTADAMRIFTIRKGERNRIDSQKLDMTAELKRRIPLTPTRKTAPQSPFPAEFEARLREDHGISHYFAVPISRGSRAWGVMVSCHQKEAELSGSQIKMLSSVANRLIAGFSGAERDEKLHSLAYVDPLTGLPNRGAMQSLLTERLAAAANNKTMAAILFIDLDRFKQANDTHGHAFGDRLLVQAANRIRNQVREDDVVARIGGDEFTVILPDVKTPREAASVARKLIQSLSRRFEIDGHTIYTGASVGIAMYPDDGVGGPELLKMADTAMYRAKSAGRSRFAFYEEPMNAESHRRSVLDGELRNALERNELVLHYQPQIDLKTGALCGVEALVRWQHPSRGLLYPNDFIEYAEEIGLIPEIGAWVMSAACQQHKRWREEGVRVPRVSVNVSNGQLPRSNFVPTVRALIEATQMPRDALEIEVTESMLVEGGKPAIEALKLLAAEGVLIAIDDFGTGYSSFSYLKTMPARVLKLDMSFLVDARLDNDAGKIVAAIINMAHALQKEVVAEGVELVEQLKLLKALGCERGQGYLFGKAVDAEHISRTFRKIAEPAPTPAPPAREAVAASAPPAPNAPAPAAVPAAVPAAAPITPVTIAPAPAPAAPSPATAAPAPAPASPVPTAAAQVPAPAPAPRVAAPPPPPTLELTMAAQIAIPPGAPQAEHEPAALEAGLNAMNGAPDQAADALADEPAGDIDEVIVVRPVAFEFDPEPLEPEAAPPPSKTPVVELVPVAQEETAGHAEAGSDLPVIGDIPWSGSKALGERASGRSGKKEAGRGANGSGKGRGKRVADPEPAELSGAAVVAAVPPQADAPAGLQNGAAETTITLDTWPGKGDFTEPNTDQVVEAAQRDGVTASGNRLAHHN
jgi:diguanylate cyclase (GGDEF)-like protein